MAGHYVSRIVQSASERVLNATVPILRKIPEYRNVEPLGCGVMLFIQGEYFLVTAAHLLNSEMWGDLVMPGANGATVSLQGELCTSHLGNKERSNIDFAILRFYPKMHRHFTIYDPILEDEILMNHSIVKKDHYLLAGYPIRKIKKTVGEKEFTFTAFKFLTHGLQDKRLNKNGFDKNIHALVAFQNKIQSFADGGIYRAVNPQGISGSGLYFIREFNQSQLNNMRVDLVGIMIENYVDKGFLAAFKIDVIIEVIRRDYGLKMNLPFTKAVCNIGKLGVGDYMELADEQFRQDGIEPPPLEPGVNRILKPVNLIK